MSKAQWRLTTGRIRMIGNQVAEDLRRCCDALQARIDELLAERDSHVADANRYRWLRREIESGRLVIAETCGWDGLKSWSGDDPDHYIDGDIAAQEKEEAEK